MRYSPTSPSLSSTSSAFEGALAARNRADQLLLAAGVLGEQNVPDSHAVGAFGVARLVAQDRALLNGVRSLGTTLDTEVDDGLLHLDWLPLHIVVLHLDWLALQIIVIALEAIHDARHNVDLWSTLGFLVHGLLLVLIHHRRGREVLVQRHLALGLHEVLVHVLHVVIHEQNGREDSVIELVVVQMSLRIESIVNVVEVQEGMVSANDDPDRVD